MYVPFVSTVTRWLSDTPTPNADVAVAGLQSKMQQPADSDVDVDVDAAALRLLEEQEDPGVAFLRTTPMHTDFVVLAAARETGMDVADAADKDRERERDKPGNGGSKPSAPTSDKPTARPGPSPGTDKPSTTTPSPSPSRGGSKPLPGPAREGNEGEPVPVDEDAAGSDEGGALPMSPLPPVSGPVDPRAGDGGFNDGRGRGSYVPPYSGNEGVAGMSLASLILALLSFALV